MAGSPKYHALLIEQWELHQRKNAGYAGEGNPDPWANFRMSEDFEISAIDGVFVRMTDKYIRLKNLRANPDNDQVHESIRDTLNDLSAYANIAICLLDEEKEEKPETESPNDTCYCEESNAPRGHIHEGNGTVLCFHSNDDNAKECPNATYFFEPTHQPPMENRTLSGTDTTRTRSRE